MEEGGIRDPVEEGGVVGGELTIEDDVRHLDNNGINGTYDDVLDIPMCVEEGYKPMVCSNDVSTILKEGEFDIRDNGEDKLFMVGLLSPSPDTSANTAIRVSKLSSLAARTRKFCANESSNDKVFGARHLKQKTKQK